MNTCMWSWWFPKWDVSKSWDEFQGGRHLITIGLKKVWDPKNCYQGVSGPWIIWSRKKILKKVIAVLLRSTIMSKWELVAILHLLQVMERSNSSKTFDKSSIQSPIQKYKGKIPKYFYFLLIIFLKIVFEIWNLWTNLRARSRHPSTVSAIFPWPWQVSLNGLGTPYIGYIATTDLNLKT